MYFYYLFVSISAYEIEYVHQDHLGNNVAITNEEGDVIWKADYEPFGDSFNEVGDNNYKYNSKEEDSTKLLYYGARYYDKDIGRFTTPDPLFGSITDPQTLNRYVYVKNNPLKYIDPTGREDQPADSTNRIETLFLYSVDVAMETGGVNNNPTFVNFPDTTLHKKFIARLDSMLLAKNNIDTSEGASSYEKIEMDIEGGYPISMTESDTVFNVALWNLENIPQRVYDISQENSPIENIIIGIHGISPDSTIGIPDYMLIAASSDSTMTAYTNKIMTNILSHIPKQSLSQNAQLMILSCYGEKCMDIQTISNKLQIPIYASPEVVSDRLDITPNVVAGIFNRYTPQDSSKTKK